MKFKDLICALAKQICTVKTSLRSQMIHKKILYILHSQFNYQTLSVTPFTARSTERFHPLNISRWWTQYTLLPWPDAIAMYTLGFLTGKVRRFFKSLRGEGKCFFIFILNKTHWLLDPSIVNNKKKIAFNIG